MPVLPPDLAATPTPADAAALAAFTDLVPRLQALARRIVGNWAEAEDVVQEAWLRWQTCDRANVRNPTAFLVTVTTRLAINAAQSAASRRELAVGEWYPEPFDPAAPDMTSRHERIEELELGVRCLLQRMSPRERAAFVLRRAFDYPYETLARMLQLTEVNVRQLVSRAHKRLESARDCPIDPDDQRRLVDALIAASERGDARTLERVLVS